MKPVAKEAEPRETTDEKRAVLGIPGSICSTSLVLRPLAKSATHLWGWESWGGSDFHVGQPRAGGGQYLQDSEIIHKRNHFLKQSK